MVMSNFEFVKNRCSENHGSRNGVNKFFACMSYIFTPFAQNFGTRDVHRNFYSACVFWKSAEHRQHFAKSIHESPSFPHLYSIWCEESVHDGFNHF
jgi:hypothetical protein